MPAHSMRRSFLGVLLASWFPHLPLKFRLLSATAALEGGQFYSVTLRRVLSRWFGVEVGPYSYGSLLEPGRADAGTVIGAYVSIGPNVRRFGAGHPLDSLSLHPFWYKPSLGFVGPDADVPRKPIEICDDSWIGANVTILPNCSRIGVGAVVGAGSVVTKDVPDFAIAVGNPARIVGWRLDDRTREALLRRKPWMLDPVDARECLAQILLESDAER